MRKKDDRIESFQNVVSNAKAHKHDEQMRERDRTIRTLNRKYDDLLVDYRNLKSDFELVSRFNDDSISPVVIEPITSSANDESIAVANASDWHAFEVVRPEEVSGLNEYNPEICEQSIKEFFKGVVRWTDIHRHGTNIKKLVLNFLGDLITGQLHDDQCETNAGTPEEEVLFVLDAITGGVDYLMKHGKYDELIINGVDGNHGRATEKMRVANRVKHSREWLLYKLLERWHSSDKRIRWNIATGQHLYMQIFDKMIRIHHGDGIKYQGGIGDITIPIHKAIKDWNTAKYADLDILGHYHATKDETMFISNGSLLGYSPYSIRIKGKFERPQQSFVVLNQKRWITSFNRIYVR